jgi:hypothetical protein
MRRHPDRRRAPHPVRPDDGVKSVSSPRKWFLCVLGACLALGCGGEPSAQPVAQNDATSAPDAADSGAGEDAEAEVPAPGDIAVEPAPPDATAPPTCPSCPEDSLCRPDRGACVGAGLVRCEPACVPGTVCGLTGTCLRPTCAARDRFPARVLKLTALTIPTDGGCGGGPTTALGRLASRLPIVATLLGDAVRADRATLLLEPTAFPEAGGSGHLTWLFGTRAPDSLRCDPTAAEAFCTYTASRDSWDATTPGAGPCDPWLASRAVFTPDPDRRRAPHPVRPDAAGEGRLSGGGLSSEAAGDPSDLLQFGIPAAGGGQVLLQLHAPALEARATVDPSNPTAVAAPGFVGLSGRLCGAVPIASLRAALAALPADVLEAVGGLATAEALLADNLAADVDLDGDGAFDAASVALAFTGTRARLSGLSP